MCATIAFGMASTSPMYVLCGPCGHAQEHRGLPIRKLAVRAATVCPPDAGMAYGLSDVVNQRRMIDESPAEETEVRGEARCPARPG